MKQRTLIKKPTPVSEITPELPGYIRIVHNDYFEDLFDEIWKRQDKNLLFDHSIISPFAYFNEGQMQLFVNEDWKQTGNIIPIVKKFKNTPRYYLYCPIGDKNIIFEKLEYINSISTKPAQIIAVNEEMVQDWKQSEYSDKLQFSKVGNEYVDDIVVQSQLKGGKYKRLRNNISKAERVILGEMGGRYERLSPDNVHLAVALFKEWQATQGQKYLRAAVGRDIRLVEHYANRMTDDIVCELVIVGDKAVSCIFSCIFKHNRTQSVAVMAKSLPSYENVSYMNELHCKKILVEKGVQFENVAGSYSTGTKMNKQKWKPAYTRTQYSISLK